MTNFANPALKIVKLIPVKINASFAAALRAAGARPSLVEALERDAGIKQPHSIVKKLQTLIFGNNIRQLGDQYGKFSQT